MILLKDREFIKKNIMIII